MAAAVREPGRGLRHAVLGAGGVGLTLAAELARAGSDVTLVVRETSLPAHPGSVRVRRAGADDVVVPVPAVARLDGPVDVLWIAVKAPQLDAALRAVPAGSVERALVVPLLNGVEHLAALEAAFGDRVVAGAIRVEARRTGAGEVVRDSLFTEVELAAPPAGLVAELERAGIGVRAAEDPAGVLWRKLVFLAPLALATAVAGPVDAVRRDPVVEDLMKDCAAEACAAAAGLGVRVDVRRVTGLLGALPGRTISSLERDVRTGTAGELDAIGGAVLRAAARAGVPAPATRTLVDRVTARLHGEAGSCRGWVLVAPHEFRRVRLPVPGAEHLEPGQVVLEVLAGGICGSDLPYVRGRVHPALPDTADSAAHLPGFPLHEVAGRVLASADPELAVGDRVVGWASRWSGLAGVVVNDGSDLFAYDPGLAPAEAVVLQPLACVLAAFDDLGDVRGQPVTVLGLGPIGLLACHVAKARGAARVTGVDRAGRDDVARAFGLDHVVRSSTDRWAASHAGRVGGVLVEAIGHQVGTLTDAVLAAADGARIHYLGIPDDDVYPLSVKFLLRKRLTLSGGWLARGRRAALAAAQEYVGHWPELMPDLVTDVVAFDDAPRAYELAAVARRGRLKVVIDFDGAGSAWNPAQQASGILDPPSAPP
ncbi:2-dehydropantoate 2-reductase N-terminal domain-containing protein [Amycolatopsis sp. CA-126428]|uniref:2-dehydropantoate 2-reductase N-terminal domain-containing protein n=1 Tax=Amycolatopsis sp. CA-126428 TaxID=2073158 RepID=UPI000CD1C624|nr:2-dehydropantoate 2-reductase N-terminal domain-containing protein [Amycolatopsis sp. CA-126428]